MTPAGNAQQRERYRGSVGLLGWPELPPEALDGVAGHASGEAAALEVVPHPASEGLIGNRVAGQPTTGAAFPGAKSSVGFVQAHQGIVDEVFGNALGPKFAPDQKGAARFTAITATAPLGGEFCVVEIAVAFQRGKDLFDDVLVENRGRRGGAPPRQYAA